MKKAISITVMMLLGLAPGALPAISGEKPLDTPAAHSKDFEAMKALVGIWEGKSDMGKGMDVFKVTYELTSAGNAILEREFAGSSHEMVTVYYDAGGKLAMTHYCSLGNRPRMELKASGDGSLEFLLSEKDHGLSAPGEMHMHALQIAFEGKDSMTQKWTLFDKGEKKSETVIKLKRVKN